jgi:flagellar basal-body rod protein FlgC
MADITNSAAVKAAAVSALRAQQMRMRIISENLANANSTSRVEGGDPYRRQIPVFEPTRVGAPGSQVEGVKMTKVMPDQSDFRTEYEPGHPGADARGYVKLPNVDPLIEALDMREAQRAYEANLNVIETSRQMDQRTLDILKK